MQMLSAGAVGVVTSLATTSNIVTSSTPPIPTPALQPNANVAASLPFLQNSWAAAAAAAAAAFPPAVPDMSSLAAFYSQLAAVDPNVQVSFFFVCKKMIFVFHLES